MTLSPDQMIILMNVLGFAASGTSFIKVVPQTIRTWRLRNDTLSLNGLSLGTQWLTVISSTLWVMYGTLLGSFWVCAPSLATGPLAVFAIVIIVRSRRERRRQHNESVAVPTG